MSNEGLLSRWRSSGPYLLSLARIVVAFLFIQPGTAKLFAFPAALLPGGSTVPIWSLLGIAGILEAAGGLLLLIGLFTRPSAFILSGQMAVAYFIGHAPQGFWPLLNQGQAAVFYAFFWLYLSAAGPGPWSVDALISGSRVVQPNGKVLRSSRAEGPNRAVEVLHVAVVHVGDSICFLTAASTWVGLGDRLAVYVRGHAPLQLWPDDAGRVERLFAEERTWDAIRCYFERVGDRWDRERLVVHVASDGVEPRAARDTRIYGLSSIAAHRRPGRRRASGGGGDATAVPRHADAERRVMCEAFALESRATGREPAQSTITRRAR